ncbi:MAG: flagellar brake protein [bacterium]|nr:flagellar brake protein [bacterium]
MKATRGIRAQLPDGIEIGQRFLLRFDDPRVEAGAYQGRLQDMSKSGLMCFDAPDDVRPRKGTPITVRSIQQNPGGSSCSFSSEIRGRGRLRGKLPVLLVEPPERMEARARRGAHRVRVCLRGNMTWREAPRCPQQRASVVITNLSGGGAQVYTRQQPDAGFLEITISAPIPFIEETARRALPRAGVITRRMSLASNQFSDACEKVNERFSGIRSQVVSCTVHSRDERGPVYALSLSFCDQQEGCYQLVRYLERQSARKGIDTEAPGPRRPLATAA